MSIKVLSLTFPIMSNLCKVAINKFVVLLFWYNMQALNIVTKNIVTGTTQSYPINDEDFFLEFRSTTWTVFNQSWMDFVICGGFSPILVPADVRNNLCISFIIDHVL